MLESTHSDSHRSRRKLDCPEHAVMRVAMYYNNTDIRIEEIPVPSIGPEELLVKVIACGICGSDVMEWYRIKKAPCVLGHEIVGEIVEVGKGATIFKVGQRVFVSHHVPCNVCRYCLSGRHTLCDTLRSTNFDPGGFAEYLRVPRINVKHGVFLIPDDISTEEAVFIEPLACVLRGQRLARLESGQTVLVLGSGISGVLHIAMARACGASRIIATDIDEYRMEAAKRFGADSVIDGNRDVSQAVREALGSRLADLTIVCAGSLSAYQQALNSTDRGGTILAFAPLQPGVSLSLPFFEFWNDGITLTSTYGASPRDIAVAIELIRSRRLPLKEMVTHRVNLNETQIGFKLVAEARRSLKVIVEPHS